MTFDNFPSTLNDTSVYINQDVSWKQHRQKLPSLTSNAHRIILFYKEAWSITETTLKALLGFQDVKS